MRRILVSALVCLIPIATFAQSGRRAKETYDPARESEAVFNAESRFKQRMIAYDYTLRVTYETPADGGRYVRVSDVMRRDSGRLVERRRVSRSSTLKLLGRVNYLITPEVFDSELRLCYHLSYLREEEGLRVFGVNPVTIFPDEWMFRGEIWVDAESRIVRARGEWLPRWHGEVFSLACTVTREGGLPKSVECDDYLPGPRGRVRVLARVEYLNLRRHGASVAVVEEGEPGVVTEQ